MSKWRKSYRGKEKSWTRRALIRAHGCACGICGNEIERMEDVTLDHIMPRYKGGGDEITNLQLAHEDCNRAKGQMTEEEYLTLQAQ